jgi:hypothetical protein
MAATSSFSELYDPQLLGALQEIFDLVWERINSTPGENAEKQQTDLAQAIILAHRSGLQPNEIKAALLSKRKRRASLQLP